MVEVGQIYKWGTEDPFGTIYYFKIIEQRPNKDGWYIEYIKNTPPMSGSLPWFCNNDLTGNKYIRLIDKLIDEDQPLTRLQLILLDIGQL